MIKEILQKGSEMLTKKCRSVEDFSAITEIIRDMRDTIAHIKTTYDFTRGIGLAAPQIGELIRITIIEYGGEEYVLVNPEIIKTSEEKHDVWEGCLSFFEYRAYVPRFKEISVTAYDETGKEYSLDAKGDFAASLQHEIDHLDGILYVNRLPNGEKDLVLSSKA
jgi:peptide deformylase